VKHHPYPRNIRDSIDTTPNYSLPTITSPIMNNSSTDFEMGSAEDTTDFICIEV